MVTGVLDKSSLIPRSELKSVAGQKRGFGDVGERSELEHNKRVKMKDLESVIRSEGKDATGIDNSHYTKSWLNKHATEISYAKETVAIDPDAIQSAEMKKAASQPVVGSSYVALDLNAKVDTSTNLDNDNTRPCADEANNQNANFKLNVDMSRDSGFDLNVEDDSSSANHDLDLIDDLECGSTCGPMEKKDPLKVWKEMKQNGFMSSSHGGVPIPKPRGRKSKADTLKKKMEIARKEQVDRFAKVAAPSGLLNGLNPGIINHVRNSKQVHSIIEALVRSERGDNFHTGNKEENVRTIGSGEARDGRNLNSSGMKRYNHCHEEGFLYNASRFKQTSDCTISSENIRGINDSSMNISTLCDEDSTDFSSVSSLSFKAANVASQWLELLQQDIRGRLGALRLQNRESKGVGKSSSCEGRCCGCILFNMQLFTVDGKLTLLLKISATTPDLYQVSTFLIIEFQIQIQVLHHGILAKSNRLSGEGLMRLLLLITCNITSRSYVLPFLSCKFFSSSSCLEPKQSTLNNLIVGLKIDDTFLSSGISFI